jgi:acyl dehydratase
MPPSVAFFEDYEVGQTFETGSILVTADVIERFAEEYDPQIFHRAETAEGTVFGALIASGWHTAALTMGLMVNGGVFPETGAVGLGTDTLRWLRPVVPGDSLHVVVRIESVKGLPGKKSGQIVMRIWTRNQHGEDVMTQTASALVKRRAPSP